MRLRPEPAIYVFTNKLNGKKYVGETINMKQRLKNHKKGKEQLIHRAIRKYGWENFDLKIIYYPYANKKFLVNLEFLLITQYNSLTTGNGYNVCKIGNDQTTFRHTAVSKVKMSKAQTGKKHSEESKLKRTGANNPNSKPIEQLNKDGKVVFKFVNAREANRLTRISYQTISKVCLGKYKSAGGFKWRFAQNN